MALEQRSDFNHTDPENFRADMYENDTERSNFTSFLIGGAVVAMGLLAFLFYDGGEMNGRDMSTSSSMMMQAPAAPTIASINTPTGPSAPAGQ